MSFVVKKHIYLRDTDATGVLYFNQLLRLALEAFEDFLISKQLPLRDIFDRKDFLLPIVHTEADFSAPLRVSDQISIEVAVEKIGESSLSMRYTFYDTKSRSAVGSALIVHVAVDRNSFQKIPFPQEFRAIL